MPECELSGAVALVLFGPPGSGKGTQAKLLRDRLGVPHISTGDILREHIQAGDRIGREVRARMKAGHLAPDALVNALLEERLTQPDCGRGFILDGYPRTRSQAERLRELVDARGMVQVVIHLAVDYNKLIARLTGRRQCPVCGTLYNLASNPPKAENVCDREGAALTLREDDSKAVILERLEAYEQQTRPVLRYFAQNGYRFFEVDASEAQPREIAERICSLVQNG
jgi:adenylate kinase